MNSAPQNHSPDFPQDAEISIYDIVQFLKKSRRHILIGLLAGLMLGGFVGAILSKERATITLDNALVSSAIGYTDWNVLSGALPFLAQEIFEKKKDLGEDIAPHAFLTSKPWWDKNVKPVFAIDKNTSKELGAVPDTIKAEYGRILRITFQAEAQQEAEAYRRADEAVAFMRSAAIFLRVQSLLEAYRVQAIQTEQDVASLFTQNTIDQAYLEKDLGTLKDLIVFNTQEINSRIATMNKVINDTNAVGSGSRNVFNIRGGETPEIPLDARLNEIKLGLHAKEIDRLKAKDQTVQNQLLQSFLEQAEPLFKAHSILTATSLLDQLLTLEQTLRAQTPAEDLVRMAKLNQIRGDLLSVQLTFINQLSVVSRSIEPVSRTFVGILGGGLGGAFLALLGAWLIGLYHQSEPQDVDETAAI
jgi:hypothetical protein